MKVVALFSLKVCEPFLERRWAMVAQTSGLVFKVKASLKMRPKRSDLMLLTPDTEVDEGNYTFGLLELCQDGEGMVSGKKLKARIAKAEMDLTQHFAEALLGDNRGEDIPKDWGGVLVFPATKYGDRIGGEYVSCLYLDEIHGYWFLDVIPNDHFYVSCRLVKATREL